MDQYLKDWINFSKEYAKEVSNDNSTTNKSNESDKSKSSGD